ncbi:hypothetical protein [Actinacidiphila epipremni]|nr:hypothetical protein [Actinacidiphila epipremni]
MIHRALTRLGVLAADGGRFTTTYCAACGGWMPIGHGCQNGNR